MKCNGKLDDELTRDTMGYPITEATLISQFQESAIHVGDVMQISMVCIHGFCLKKLGTFPPENLEWADHGPKSHLRLCRRMPGKALHVRYGC